MMKLLMAIRHVNTALEMVAKKLQQNPQNQAKSKVTSKRCHLLTLLQILTINWKKSVHVPRNQPERPILIIWILSKFSVRKLSRRLMVTKLFLSYHYKNLSTNLLMKDPLRVLREPCGKRNHHLFHPDFQWVSGITNLKPQSAFWRATSPKSRASYPRDFPRRTARSNSRV